MSYVVALHGSAGSGKSTLVRTIKEYLGNDCLVFEENIHELLSTTSTADQSVPWFRRTTSISASDNITQMMMEKIGPFSMITFTLLTYIFLGSVWPAIIIFVVCFALCRLCRWLNSHILSKMWLCNVGLFLRCQKTNNYRWIWHDRTCVDIYAYCLLNRCQSVPSNLPAILLEQTKQTSVAVILDRPYSMIEQHLRKRIASPSSSRVVALSTALIVYLRFPIDGSIRALKVVERWYSHFKIPFVKISQIEHQLDHDPNTGDIQWNEHSIKILLQKIERAIQERESSTVAIDESLIPWQTERNARLYYQ